MARLMPHIEHTFALVFALAYPFSFIALSMVHSHFIAPSEFLCGILWPHKMPQFIEWSDNSTIFFILFWYKTVEIDFRCDFKTCKKMIISDTTSINAIRIKNLIFFILSFEEKSQVQMFKSIALNFMGFEHERLLI